VIALQAQTSRIEMKDNYPIGGGNNADTPGSSFANLSAVVLAKEEANVDRLRGNAREPVGMSRRKREMVTGEKRQVRRVQLALTLFCNRTNTRRTPSTTRVQCRQDKD
jgi:hypothetical protein